jgi:hypothetical protein
MTDQPKSDSNSGEQSTTADGNILSDKHVAVGMGAVVGGLSTLAATLSLKEVLQDNPFVALAVFALLGAFLIFAVALTGPPSRLWPVASFAIALLCTGVAAGSVATIKGPARVKLLVSAMPTINDAKPIKLGQYDVAWGTPTSVRAGGDLTLDLTSLQSYYDNKQKILEAGYENSQKESLKQCFNLLDEYSKLNLGPGKPAT